MKKINLINFSITLIMLFTFQAKATIYTIGNDTIHSIAGNYYFIDAIDTVMADTSVITVEFVHNIQLSNINAFVSNFNLTLVEELSSGNYQYKLPIGHDYISLCDSITNDASIEKLITHFFMEVYDFEPDDYEISNQWYLKNIGVYDETTLEGVWEITKGSSDVIIAVLDSGLDWDAEEFDPDGDLDVVHNNSNEDDWSYWNSPGSGNDTDDDLNGYVDDYKGWDYRHIDQLSGGSNQHSTDNDVRPNHSDYWHGNAVAGIIAAKTNNDEGVAGIAGGDAYNELSGVKILPMKIADLYNFWGVMEEWLSTADVELAICNATDMGAKVINMSFGCGFDPKENLEAEVDYAYDNGVTLVAAAGNEGYTSIISYPAIMDKVIAVGATDDDDEHSDFSNEGDEIEVSAPGEDIVVLEEDGEYTTYSEGTSFSTPMVSATVGLMLSVNPHLTNEGIDENGSIRNILKRTADKTGYHSYTNGWNKYLGYGRLNTYEAVCMAIDYLPEMIVESNDSWDDRVYSPKDITIKEGVSLTITGEVMMGKNAKIIVEPGAVLTIDGGTITNIPFCDKEDERWSGIEVWGISSDNQLEYAGHPLVQGKLILESATIENSIVAVRLFNINEINETTGGIITARNSLFKNNTRSVSFYPYQNIVNSYEHDYVSYFKNCTFTVDNDYIEYSTFDNNEHILMYGVKGIKLFGCIFENNLDSYPTGRAIYTNNAGFKIEGACDNVIVPCPSEYLTRTSFDGFYSAIESSNNATALYNINISESDFTHNGIAIHFSSINDATVVGNNIELGEHDDCSLEGSTGIYLDNCKRFAIEENNFSLHDPAYAVTNIGIFTINTNNAFDEIYKNYFDDMIIANYADGKNWSIDRWKGLAYYCNGNQNNDRDFYVNDDDGSGTFGIQKFQGSTTYVAGNTFSSSATGHFDNWGSFELEYHYDNNSLIQTPTLVYRVDPMWVNLSNTCPSHYSGGSIKLSSSEYQSRESNHSSALSSLNYAEFQYDSIGQNGDSATLRLLEKQMSYYNTLLSRAAYDIIKSDLADTVTYSDLFSSWLEDLGTYTAIESLVDMYMQQGDTTTALNKVDSLQYNFTFSEYDSIEYSYYSQLKTSQSIWIGDDRSIFELTTLEINKLSSIADSSQGVAGAQARGILAFTLDSIYSYSKCIPDPETSHKSSPNNGSVIDSDKESYIKVSPNPASDNINFEYVLPENSIDGIIKLFDTSGKLVTEVKTKNTRGTITIDCTGLRTGIYYYRFSSGNVSQSSKIIIK